MTKAQTAAWTAEGLLERHRTLANPDFIYRYGSPFSRSAYRDVLVPYGFPFKSTWYPEDGGARDRSHTDPVRTNKESSSPLSAVAPESRPAPNPELLRLTNMLDECPAGDLLDLHGFLGTLYPLASRGDTQRAIDVILRFFDLAMINNNLLKCELLLWFLEPAKLGPAMIISVLCITEGLSQKCPARESFYNNAISSLAKQRGYEGAERLLKPYR